MWSMNSRHRHRAEQTVGVQLTDCESLTIKMHKLIKSICTQWHGIPEANAMWQEMSTPVSTCTQGPWCEGLHIRCCQIQACLYTI